jgi:hypothetical protein
MLDRPQSGLDRILIGDLVHHVGELMADTCLNSLGRQDCTDDLFGSLLAEVRRVAIARLIQEACAIEVLAGDP